MVFNLAITIIPRAINKIPKAKSYWKAKQYKSLEKNPINLKKPKIIRTTPQTIQKLLLIVIGLLTTTADKTQRII